MGTLLFYFQDLGGTNFLLPSLQNIRNELPSDIQIMSLCHPLSKKIISEVLFETEPINFTEFPISVSEWQKLLQVNDIQYIVSTLSSNRYDLSNANLITAAKKNDIPSLGFMDHWKGFDRLFNNHDEPIYCPDWLGVIDEYCVKDLRNKKVSSLFCHVGYLGRKINNVNNFKWSEIALDDIVCNTKYPLISRKKSK